MIASDYAVTFGYGATDGVYYYTPTPSKPKTANWIGNYHRGDDRAMQTSTPVVVNGVVIGLSGDGNGRYGAHLHVGKFVGGGDVNPNGGGFKLEGAVVTKVLDDYSDPVNGKYVWIEDSSGATWVYLHMKEVNVSVGQKLEGSDEMTQQEAYAVVSQIYRVATDVDPEPGQADYWAKRIQANPATAAELASALGGNDYKGDSNFRYYGRHYSEDMTTAKKQAYDEGLAVGGGKDPSVVVNGSNYVKEK